MQTTNSIRSAFLDYFAKHDHAVLPSSSLVPHNDPTLMFTNAGMNQFKNIFTGAESAPTPPRAATSQKCVRAGGKHNDLDNVGYTARHHTFFEMLGNFSFGDYFKERAIHHAWTLITKEFAINPEKLCVTVYHTDDEAFDLWRKIAGLKEEKIIRIDTNDNFWAMGDTGPCGPCSEIFYDHGENIPGGPPGSKDADGDRFIEIWNLVFMQYEQKDKDTRIALPKPSIDTGMGLERITAVMQGVHDNYDIDLFHSLIAASREHSRSHDAAHLVSHRVIADHLRSSGFLIADGVLPSNEGRGYVLRRIMRRAMRHAHMLGCTDPLLHKLVPSLVAAMGDAFSELKRSEALIRETLKLEEERFKQTLERGLKLLEEEKRSVAAGGLFSGGAAFKLYDTYGFPLDLTEDILRQNNIQVDKSAFDAAMNEQKQRARAAWAGSGDTGTQALWFDIKDVGGVTEFLGYSATTAQAIVTALVKDGKSVDQLSAGEEGFFCVNQTPFYAESGGQVGDSGTVTSESGAKLTVRDTQKPLEGLHAHAAVIASGTLRVGDVVTLTIDEQRRDRIRANHSATHLLHSALRNQLGTHVTQKGSMVSDDRLRFDITHPKQITRDELDAIEAEVNRVIWNNGAITTTLMTPDEAIAAGAMALFGEKYGSEVRVLSMGASSSHSAYSVELCGGTHAASTGDIGLFKIISESAVASGIRRIEAVTQTGAFAYLSAQEQRLRELALSLKIKQDDVVEKVLSLSEEKRSLEKQLAEAKKQLALGGSGGISDITPESLGAFDFIGKSYPDLDGKSLRDLAASLQQKHPNCVVALASGYEGKASIIIAVGKAISGRVDAPALVRDAAVIVGGKGGGGKPDMAQAGGSDAGAIDQAIATIRSTLSQAAAA
jgi:alanyl-tRNA synthetase